MAEYQRQDPGRGTIRAYELQKAAYTYKDIKGEPIGIKRDGENNKLVGWNLGSAEEKRIMIHYIRTDRTVSNSIIHT